MADMHREAARATYNLPTVHELTDEQVATILARLPELLATPMLIANCTPRGKGGKLKTSRPGHGLYAYVWRQARFHSGADTTMPINDTYYLGQWVRAEFGIPLCISLIRPNVRKLLDVCDAAGDRLCVALGLTTLGAAIRWGQAFGRF